MPEEQNVTTPLVADEIKVMTPHGRYIGRAPRDGQWTTDLFSVLAGKLVCGDSRDTGPPPFWDTSDTAW